jgi:hypothetical protein
LLRVSPAAASSFSSSSTFNYSAVECFTLFLCRTSTRGSSQQPRILMLRMFDDGLLTTVLPRRALD